MNKLLSHCPVCNGALKITTLQCSDCGMELKNEFQPSPFERLNQEQYDFLITFLSFQGNLKALQEELGISYPFAKKKLNDLLMTLEIGDLKNKMQEEKNNTEWEIDTMSKKASDIIKNKLFEEGCSAVIPLVRKNCRIFGNNTEFGSDSLGNVTFPYEIFDLITDHLLANGGKATKGLGRNARIGDKKCELDTLTALIGMKHFHRNIGEYTFDAVFVLAAMMEWAGIAYNKRGYVELTAGYQNSLAQEQEMPDLGKEFEHDLWCKVERMKTELNYTPTLFIQMLHQFGGVETARRLIQKDRVGELSDGFTKLWEKKRLDLSMESSVCDEKFQPLFTPEEIATCKKLLS